MPIPDRKKTVFTRLTAVVTVVCFAFALAASPTQGNAQELPSPPGGALTLPAPGTMVSPSRPFVPPLLKGLKIFPENPLRFDFIVDSGNAELTPDDVTVESTRLIKYFLAALTIPDGDLWVNLSPYEGHRIIPDKFSVTDMGRDLLAQDYLLKQLTASLIYPEDDLGKAFWDRVNARAIELYGTMDIPLNTFNKVWVMPETAVVYENNNIAFVAESRLKVLLEGDYRALQENLKTPGPGANHLNAGQVGEISELQSQILREIVLPEIENEINEGQNFARLRQVYHAVILATWFKRNLKASLLGRVYVGENKITGVDIEDTAVRERIYQQYLDAFKTGVYNFIREDENPLTHETVPRKYFSGGMEFAQSTWDVLESIFVDRPELVDRVRLSVSGNALVVATYLETVRNLKKEIRLLKRAVANTENASLFDGLTPQSRMDEVMDALVAWLHGNGLIVRQDIRADNVELIIVDDRVKTRYQLGGLLARLTQGAAGIRMNNYTRPDGSHVIIGFAGEATDAQIEKELSEVAKRQSGQPPLEAFIDSDQASRRERLTMNARAALIAAARQRGWLADQDILAASIQGEEGKTIVYPKSTYEGRNDDITELLLSPLFQKIFEFDLLQGPRKIMDMGVGILPVTTAKMAEAVRERNPFIEVTGTDLPGVAPKAFIRLPEVPQRFREDVVAILKKNFPLAQIAPNDISDLIMTVDHNNQPLEVVMVVTDDNEKLYKTIAVSPNVTFWGFRDSSQRSEEIVEEDIKNTVFFNQFVDYINRDILGGENNISRFVEQGAHPDGLIVEYAPVAAMLQQSKGKFVATGNPSADGLRGMDVITVAHLAMADKREELQFLKNISVSLKDGGVILLKKLKVRERVSRNFQSEETFFKNLQPPATIQAFQKINGKLQKKFQVNTWNTHVESMKGPLSPYLQERDVIMGRVRSEFPGAEAALRNMDRARFQRLTKLRYSILTTNEEFERQFREFIQSDLSIALPRPGPALEEAGTVTEPAKTAKDLGGIDLNPAAINLEQRGQGMDFDIPFDPQFIENIDIDGFSPVILQITPANLPALIGASATDQASRPQLSLQTGSKD